MREERQSQAALLGANDKQKEALHIEELDDDDMSYLSWAKIGCGALAFLSGLFMVIFVSIETPKENFELTVEVNRSLRTGAVLAVDGYPEIDSSTFGIARVAMTGGFVGILGGLGYLVAYLTRRMEWAQMRGNSNPYVWIFNLFWNVPYFLVIAFVAGVPDVIVLTFISLVVVAWIFLFWLDDIMQSYGYQLSVLIQTGSVASMFNWVPVVMILFLAVSTLTIIFVHLGYTFSAVAAPHAILLTVPLVLSVLYLANPIVYFLHRYRTGITSIFMRDLILYLINGLMILLAVWLPFAVFSGDDITPYHPSHAAPIIAGVQNAGQGFEQTSSAASLVAAPLTAAAVAIAARM